MDLAVVYDKYSKPDAAGARISLQTLLKGLAPRNSLHIYQENFEQLESPGIETAVNSFDIREIPKFVWANQYVERNQWRRRLRRAFQSTDFDCVITQGSVGPAAVTAANSADVRSVLFIRSLQQIGVEKFDPNNGLVTNFLETDFGGKLQFPFLFRNVQAFERAMSRADSIVANSEFTAANLERLFDVESEVIYPPIRLENFQRVENEGKYITMVNPRSTSKGVDIFLDIAESNSEADFLLVGNISPPRFEDRARKIDNVTLFGWTDNVTTAYDRSKLVVVPSRYEEPFGRVAAEAMASGIPCVVSDRGGLPEVVGETGEVVTDIESTEQWVEAISEALENHDRQAQLRRVKNMFSAGTQIAKLETLL